MITLAQLLKANGEEHHYAFIHDKCLVQLDPSLPEFPMASQIGEYSDCGNSEKIWCVTKADNQELWLVAETNYDNLDEFIKNHKFTITMKDLEKLVSNEVCLESFKKKYCSTCGSQRCDGSPEWMEECGKWKKFQDK